MAMPIPRLVASGASAMLFLVTFLLLVTPAAHADRLAELREQGSIRIAIADERPYGYLGQDGRVLGAGPEIIRRIIDRLGIPEIDWVVTEFSNLIPGLEVGRFDMVAAEMAILPEHCSRVLFSEPNTSYGEGLLTLASNPKQILRYEDFAERPETLRVIVRAGTVQEEIMDTLGVPEERVLVAQGLDEAAEAVIQGRADAFAASGMTVAALETRHPELEAEFNFSDPVVDGEELRYWGGFAFPKDTADLRDAVNETLEEEKHYGDWQQVLSRHGFLAKDIIYSNHYNTETLCQAAGG